MRSKLNYKQFNFTGGKITESTFFNQPDNTALTLQNFTLNTSGEVQRRLGITREANGVNNGSLDLTDKLINTFLWKSVDGNADTEILVVQVGDQLQFYDFTSSVLSTQLGTLDISGFRITEDSYNVQFASGEGVLFVVGKHLEPFYVTYTSGVFAGVVIEVEVRDIDGVDDGLENEARPSSLSVLHEYNLRNQGWPLTFEVSTEVRNPNTIEGSSIQVADPVQYTKTKLGVYPSNADYIHVAKRTFPNGMNPYEPFKLEELTLGNTRAARGKFILNAFMKDRSGASSSSGIFGETVNVPNGLFGSIALQLPGELVAGVAGLTTEVTEERPTAVAFYSGRVFYAGKEAGSKSTRIFFSQFLTDITKAGRCYQEQDPTAEQLNSVLATDGGVVPMPDAGEVFSLIPYRRGILIIAENGIWFLAGSPDTGFTATDFSIQKISEETTISPHSVVIARDKILFWGEHGIYMLGQNESGELQADNISEKTIQSDYNAIDQEAKTLAKGFYDSERNEVLWCYSTDMTRASKYMNDRILFLNITLGAFYDYVLPSGALPYIVSPVDKSGLVKGTNTVTVTDNSGVAVTDSLGADVTINLTTFSGTATTLKYLILVPTGATYAVTFGGFTEGTFTDWDFYSATNFTSSLQTGWNVLEDGARDKQIKWLLLHFRRTESGFSESGFLTPSSALAQVKFEFTDTSTTGRWEAQYQAYRLAEQYLDDGGAFDYSYQVITHKRRVRGHGRGVSISISSESGKDLRILGWDVEFTGRARV